jgi:DNA-binding HxlR family transcriptional regulator
MRSSAQFARSSAGVGGRWTLDIMMLLGNGPHHFADLDRSIPAISRRMLTVTSDTAFTRTSTP